MAEGTVQCATACVALADGISEVSILLAGNWALVSPVTKNYFITYTFATDWHQNSFQYAVLGSSE